MRRAVVLAVVMAVTSCHSRPTFDVKQVVLLTREGCATSPTMQGRLDEALRVMGVPTTYQKIDVVNLPATDARRGYPTPTVLYANRDIFGMPEPKPPYPDPT